MQTDLNDSSSECALLKACAEHLATQLIGHETLVRRLQIALLTGGHLLIEGAPGLAKTRAINKFAESVSAKFARIQSTPDLLPADITGTDIYQQDTRTFKFLEGPLFNNIVLVDEINRAPPKVQSAMLEAMGEGQITSGGVSRQLDKPFMVAATQNPIEHEGTYPLPEAQKDRFMFFVDVHMPNSQTERHILDTVLSEISNNAEVTTVNITATHISNASSAAKQVHLSEPVRDYIVRLTTATRGEGLGGKPAAAIRQAASPRGSIYLAIASKANAWLEGRDFVSPEDVALLAPDVLSGRIALQYKAVAEGVTARDVINELIAATPKV